MSARRAVGSGASGLPSVYSGGMGDDAVRYDDDGYWEHWWHMLHDPTTDAAGRMTMDTIVPTGTAFPSRSWHTEFDRAVRDYALTGPRITGRAIVPPETIGSPAEPMIEMGLDHGFEVRVLPSRSRFAIYNGIAAVLTDALPDASTDVSTDVSTDEEPNPRAGSRARAREAHTLTRSASVVEALQQLFELQWAVALDWGLRADDAQHILEMLARGWTDERISTELGVSARTVSRRVSELMRSTGSASRFALGMRFGSTGIRGS